jgi:hypothetical protein
MSTKFLYMNTLQPSVIFILLTFKIPLGSDAISALESAAYRI